MKFLFYILCAALHTWVRLLGGTPKRQLVAEVVALRAQLILAKRKAPRASKIPPLGRLLLACVYSLIPKRIHAKTLILVKPATVLKFHQCLVNRKYSRLYRNHQRMAGRPPLSKEIKNLILEKKTKNPSFGCPQIASLILDRTGLSVSEETVLAVLQIDDIWSVPFVPISHFYIEQMIGTVRRELLDRNLFWNGRDLLKKLET